MSYNKNLQASGFFKTKGSASRSIDDSFNFFEQGKQKSLVAEDKAYMATGSGESLTHESEPKNEELESNSSDECGNLGSNSTESLKQNSNDKMYGSIGTLTTNNNSFDFMTPALLESLDKESEDEIKNLKNTKQGKEKQLKSQQEQLYNRCKNVYISKKDIEELNKIVEGVKDIQNTEEIKLKIKEHNEKYIKLLYLISKLNEQQVIKLEKTITKDGKTCKYGFCNEDSVFNDIKQTQKVGNKQYVGLVFGKRSKSEDVKDIYNLISVNKNFKYVINMLEAEQTELLMKQMEECKSSINDLEKQLKEIEQRKDELLILK